jgi:hypothetical protein
MDTAGATLANGIIRALVRGEGAEAGRLLDRLFECDPGYRQLGGLERLVAAERKQSPVVDIGLELSALQHVLCPLAEEILGSGARHYLAPQWQRLTRALHDVDFDPGNPEIHSSYTALRGEDWGQIKSSVEATSNWGEQPVLLRRHARACGRLHLDYAAVSDWFRLCWCFPDQAAHIGDEAEPQWRRAWLRFLELDPELPIRDFPAWALIDQPSLAGWLATGGCFDDIEVPQDYRATAGLVQAKSSPLVDPDLMGKRMLLQQCNPELFASYLQSIVTKSSG